MLVILAMAAATATLAPDEAVAAKNRADLQSLYDQSCAVRAYGSYDDMCAKLRQSIKAYERDQAKAARDRARAPRSAPTPAPSPIGAAPSAAPSTALSLSGN